MSRVLDRSGQRRAPRTSSPSPNTTVRLAPQASFRIVLEFDRYEPAEEPLAELGKSEVGHVDSCNEFHATNSPHGQGIVGERSESAIRQHAECHRMAHQRVGAAHKVLSPVGRTLRSGARPRLHTVLEKAAVLAPSLSSPAPTCGAHGHATETVGCWRGRRGASSRADESGAQLNGARRSKATRRDRNLGETESKAPCRSTTEIRLRYYCGS